MICERVSNQELLLPLMQMRNEARSFMTGSQELITWQRQIEWFSKLDHELVKVWLYGEEPGKWLGYGQLRIEPGDVTYGVTTNAVTQSARGLGYGEKILTHLIEMASHYNCDSMRAEIFKNNAASLGLCYKLGYVNGTDMGDIVEVKRPL
jgi:L-amino acid N-acyltransferase YncA